jgi:hypothetical protein
MEREAPGTILGAMFSKASEKTDSVDLEPVFVLL